MTTTRTHLWIAALATALGGAAGGVTATQVESEDPPETTVHERTIEHYSDGDDTDWLPEVQAFLDDPARPRTLVFGRGDYVLRGTADVCRGVEIRGQGRATQIVVSPSATVFRVASGTECGNGAGGRETVIRDLTVRNNGSVPETQASAIVLHRPALLADVTVQGPWANGVRIEADKSTGANANLWTLRRVRVHNTRHAGVLVRGGDSNVGLAEQVSVVGACAQPEDYPVSVEWPECAGIVDASFLGSTWIAAHVSDSWRAYRFQGASQRSVCVGCYREQNQASGLLSRRSVALGGLSGWAGGGIVIGAGRISPVTLVRPTIQTAHGDTDPTPLLMRWQSADATMRADVELTDSGFRGSRLGSNVKTAWWWNVGAPSFVGVAP